MGDVLQPLEMLGPEGVQAEMKTLELQYTLEGERKCFANTIPWVFALARLWNGRPMHFNKITSKANSTLGCLRRNLKA